LVDLAAEEAAGGHTIARHVGKTEQELRRRLASNPRMDAASSFVDLAQATQAVDAALLAHASAIARWLARNGPRALNSTLTLRWDQGRPLGQVLLRATGRVQTSSRMRLVLRLASLSNKGYIVVTAFPDA
jgi:hypothetical protein